MLIPRTDWEVAEWLASQLTHLHFVRGEWLKFSNNWSVLPRDSVLNELGETISTHISNLYALAREAEDAERDRYIASAKAFKNFLNWWKLCGVANLLKAKLGRQVLWDQQDKYLPTINGKVDLKTGELLRVDKEDYITRFSPIAFDPTAKCPRWEQFINEITQDNQDLASYIQRAVGYTLTGFTYEQVLFILVGPGSNGKNILLETLYDLFGANAANTLAHQTTFKVLERAYGNDTAPGAASPHLAAMEGVRYVMASESHEGSSFNDGLVKSLTGDGNITARRLHQEEKVFQNRCKFWLACNNLPRVHDMSQGFWRRIQLIQLDKVFKDKDKDLYLRDKLRKEMPGILNWAIRGAIDWHSDGLTVPKKVQLGVEDYRRATDYLQLFIDEHCLVHPNVQSVRKNIYAKYKEFVRDEYGHTKYWSVETLTDKLSAKGIKYKKQSQHFLIGICLRSEAHNFNITQEELSNDNTVSTTSVSQARGNGDGRDSSAGATVPSYNETLS